MKTWLFVPVIFAATLGGGSAGADTRTYCYELVFKDDRYDCPVAGDAGVRRACQEDFYNWTNAPDGEYTHPVGGYVEIWDHDDSSPDDYIGTWVVGGTGRRCVTFEWEGAAYSNGENNPDLYVKGKSKVRGPPGGPAVQAVDLAGNEYGDVTWRAAHITDCQAGSNCDQPGYLLVSSDTTTERGGRVMALDSAQHMLQVYHSILDGDQIDMGWPSTVSEAFDRHYFELDETQADEPQAPTHELGHLLQMQQFGQDTLVDDCTLSGAGHTLTSAEYESCVTTEGWAAYVALVSLWDPQAAGAAPVRYGVDYEDGTPYKATCSDNTAYQVQATKGFWDLDDDPADVAVSPANNDDANDSDTLFLAGLWANFANGTGNRQNDENDVDGVNLKDYYENNSTLFASPLDAKKTLLSHNCMGTQDPN
jgi:hypothetical protein